MTIQVMSVDRGTHEIKRTEGLWDKLFAFKFVLALTVLVVLTAWVR